MTIESIDRRAECRYPTIFPCQFSLVDEPESASQNAKIIDVATNGLMLDVSNALPQRTRLDIHVGETVIRAKVVRSVKHRIGWFSYRYFVGVRTSQPLCREMFQHLAYPDASFSVRISEDYLDRYFRSQFR